MGIKIKIGRHKWDFIKSAQNFRDLLSLRLKSGKTRTQWMILK
jgi:hypothetical protein